MSRSLFCVIAFWLLAPLASANTTWYSVFNCGAFCNESNIVSSKAAACTESSFNFSSPPRCTQAGESPYADAQLTLNGDYCEIDWTCANDNTYFSSFYINSFSCSDGFKWDGYACVEDVIDCSDPQYPSGSSYDPTLEQCVCPAGQTTYFGSDASLSCVTELPECVPGSSQHIGYVGDTPVCDYNGFCNSGESGGIVDTGSGPSWLCVPEACQGGTYINGSCISDTETTQEPQQQFDEPDTDGDGIPDTRDEDIDGDGISNSQDPDRDGDGVANEDDTADRDEGTASASGGCSAAPVCTGDDPQECAILKQQWYAMCHSYGDFKAPDDSGFSSAAQDRFDTAQTDFESLLSDIGSQISEKMDFGLSAGGGSLPHDQRSIFGESIDFSIARWAGDLGNIGNILYFACTLLAAGIILRR